MKYSLLVLTAAAVLLGSSLSGTPAAAMPRAPLTAVSGDGQIQNVNGVRRHYRHFHVRHPLLEVYPGLYYDCRPGWYCFGPPLRPNFRRAWYGGFNSIYGYQGARWRPPSKESGS